MFVFTFKTCTFEIELVFCSCGVSFVELGLGFWDGGLISQCFGVFDVFDPHSPMLCAKKMSIQTCNVVFINFVRLSETQEPSKLWF